MSEELRKRVHVAPDEEPIDSPAIIYEEDSAGMALVRQEYFSYLHRVLASKVIAFWPLKGNSKTVKSCKKEGLLPGLQGMFARLFNNFLQATTDKLDAFLPHPPESFSDPEVSKELEDAGIPGVEIERILKEMIHEARTVSLKCQAMKESVKDEGHISLSTTPTGDFLLVFTPSTRLVDTILAPIRNQVPLVGVEYGDLNIPLYNPRNFRARDGVSKFTSSLRLNRNHFSKLSLLYQLHRAHVEDPLHFPVSEEWKRFQQATSLEACLSTTTATGNEDDTHSFLRRLFCMVARYETYSGNTSGLQGSIPHHVFDRLEQVVQVNRECFASPLNCHFPRYYSAFPDTDQYFGSCGSFFTHFFPTRGCFEANPPFIVSMMGDMVNRFHDLLAQNNRPEDFPLVFFVIIPSWKDAESYVQLEKSKYLVASCELFRKSHEYIDGMQHRVSRYTWSANTESTWFLLSNESGEKLFLRNNNKEELVASVQNAFHANSSKVDDNNRVFKFAC